MSGRTTLPRISASDFGENPRMVPRPLSRNDHPTFIENGCLNRDRMAASSLAFRRTSPLSPL
jgi:hypothetical protein